MAWVVIFYATAEGSMRGADFLDGCPAKVRGTILAVLDTVAAAPPARVLRGRQVRGIGKVAQLPSFDRRCRRRKSIWSATTVSCSGPS